MMTRKLASIPPFEEKMLPMLDEDIMKKAIQAKRGLRHSFVISFLGFLKHRNALVKLDAVSLEKIF